MTEQNVLHLVIFRVQPDCSVARRSQVFHLTAVTNYDTLSRCVRIQWFVAGIAVKLLTRRNTAASHLNAS